MEVVSVRAKGNTLHIHQDTLRTLGQSRLVRFVIKASAVGILSLLFLGVTYGIDVPTTRAYQGNTSVVDMIYQVFGPDGAAATNVAFCESSLNPYAYNSWSIGGSHAEGLFQILYPSTWSSTSYWWASPYDAWANIEAAHQIFIRDGYSWREWACQPY